MPLHAAVTADPLTLAMVGIGAALAIGVLLLAVLLLVRRSGRAADDRIAGAIAEMEARMEAMVRELSDALEHAEEENRRGRMLGDLPGTIDLDQVLERAVGAAVELAEADAGLLRLDTSPDGRPAVAVVGLSPDEAERHWVVVGPPDGRLARAVTLEYRYKAEEGEADEPVFRAGLAVPIVLDDLVLGHVAVFTRRHENGFAEEAIDELEALAQRAAPAIENALRFREARQLADLDALTGLHNRRYFHETLDREVSRAHRYGRKLSLIVLDLDEFKAVNDRIGHLAGDSVLAEAAERMRSVVRSADVPCRVGGDEFAVILPESTLHDAEQLCRRIQHAVVVNPLGQGGTLYISAGVGELAPDEDARAFFQRADDALYRAKESGRGGLAEAMPGSRATGTA
jgi:diguanylate cyclase (GGDEF)-like protein